CPRGTPGSPRVRHFVQAAGVLPGAAEDGPRFLAEHGLGGIPGGRERRTSPQALAQFLSYSLRGIPCLHARSPPLGFLHPASYQVKPRQGLATDQRPDTGSASLTRNTRGASPTEPGAGALKATTARNSAGYQACRPPSAYPPTRRRGRPDLRAPTAA